MAPMRMWVNTLAGFGIHQSVDGDKQQPFLEGVFWADIDGDGVEDYVDVVPNSDYGPGAALRQGRVVDPSTNKAWTRVNVYPDGSGLVTPSLPSGAPAAPSPASPSSGATTTNTQGAGSGSGSRSDAGPSGGSGYVTIDPAL
nr:hypothetical protein B0A51_11595 [Rachicladosporium sp. CCFEE 5018]